MPSATLGARRCRERPRDTLPRDLVLPFLHGPERGLTLDGAFATTLDKTT